MGMEHIKPIIWLKHVGNLNILTHSNTWNSVGQQSSVGKSDLAQSSHFSDEQTNLEIVVAETKLDPRTPDCCLIQSLLYIPRELLKAYLLLTFSRKKAWLPCLSEIL